MATKPTSKKPAVALKVGTVTDVAIAQVHPDPNQPRKVFDEKALAALAANVKARGIYQPILVRYVDGKVTIIDGERRLRAAKIARLKTVPVLLQDAGTYEDEALQADQVGLNQLGERLRPMEIARQLRKWRDAGKTPNEIAKLLSDMGHEPMKPAAIGELTELTDLPDWAQGMVDRDELAPGPAGMVVDLVAMPGVEKLLRKALEQDVGYRGAVTAREVRGRGGDALRTIGVNLDRTESWYGEDAVHFAWKERCKNCEHLVKWDGGGYCLNKKLFAEHQAEAKAAGLGPGGKRPDTKLRDDQGRITTPEKVAEQKAEQRDRSLVDKARDYLHTYLVKKLRPAVAGLPDAARWLVAWVALDKPGDRGRRAPAGVHFAEPGTKAAATRGIKGFEDILNPNADVPSLIETAAQEILCELPWRETLLLARQFWGMQIENAWQLDAEFLALFRKSELAHLAEQHAYALPAGRRSWGAFKTDELQEALLAVPALLARPAILVDLYEGKIDKPYVPYGRFSDKEDEAVCIGCGCTHTDPCEEGCGWATDIDVDTEGRFIGVCDSQACEKHVERFEDGDDLSLTPEAQARVAEREAMRGAAGDSDDDADGEDDVDGDDDELEAA